ncbi:7,8-dihydro-8-oxoguanine triphosphatase-like [Cimex lectularius]|uniref:Oxidized purine nucleoside triphosphate hydrolase n=1 Tax=Cimex lectularius TaxID=79782 RepID=A0A8I6S461_CIMLE|nr:7,8-dihydro-8-oxoguanine triphosphatase-like [Cimex lectularius]
MRILRSSVVLVKKDDQLLLGLNKRGFNRGKWTGFGGVVQPKEDLKICALKNTKDQCGISVEKLEKVGKVEVKIAGVQEVVQMHIFISDTYSGEVKPSKDMQPEWFSLKDLPYKSMWPDANYWLPHIVKGEKIKGFFVYQNETLIYQDLNTDAFNNRLQKRNYSNGILSR